MLLLEHHVNRPFGRFMGRCQLRYYPNNVVGVGEWEVYLYLFAGVSKYENLLESTMLDGSVHHQRYLAVLRDYYVNRP